MIKTALVFGGAYAAGSLGGEKIAAAAGFTSDGAKTGTKIATGVVAFFVLSMFLR
jgi:hypothetical protein